MIIFFLMFFVYGISAEESYESSDSICKRCSCVNLDYAQTYSLNCTNQNLHHMLDVWPEPKAVKITAFFFDNNITTLETIPPTEAVLEIMLSRCNIKILDPRLFANAKHTRLVDLSFNKLTYESMTRSVFSGPYNNSQMVPIDIEYLSLAYNEIHSLNKDIFDFIPNLKHLNLEGNNFKVLDYHTQLALSSATNLLDLNLANNNLLDLIDSAIERCAKLVKINLSHNLLDLVPSSLGRVSASLETLIIDNNPIFELDIHSFEDLTNLIEISANNLTKIKYVNSSTFSNLKKLKKVHLSNNLFLKVINDSAFGENSNVEEVYLSNNNLSHLSINLLQWSKLVIFELKGNPLHCDCDLFNISQALASDITRNEDSPYCIHPKTKRSLQVYSLTRDICQFRKQFRVSRIYRHISPPMVGLIITLGAAFVVVMVLGYSRYRTFLRHRNYPYTTQVLYNPIATS